MADEDEQKYIPFGDREEWKDVTPIPQDDGPKPVCVIAYSEQFADTMNYFRAILHRDERSERSYQLTNEVIKLNPANYTAWYFRRLVIEAINADLKKELEFVSSVGNDNPKNYQIWYHRKTIVEKSKDFSHELEFTAGQIEEDNKNYHAWAYRQWVVETLQAWDSELVYIDTLMADDFRNNSAWNQRYFVITRKNTQQIQSAILEREINYALSYIKKAPNNQSPWTYLKGLFKGGRFSDSPTIKQLLTEFSEQYPTSPHAAALLMEIYEEERTKESIQRAIELCDSLENHLDTFHRKYWSYKRAQLEQASKAS